MKIEHQLVAVTHKQKKIWPLLMIQVPYQTIAVIEINLTLTNALLK